MVVVVVIVVVIMVVMLAVLACMVAEVVVDTMAMIRVAVLVVSFSQQFKKIKNMRERPILCGGRRIT
jgi:hypothetical protein